MENKGNKVTLTCTVCGGEYEVLQSEQYERKTCSMKCRRQRPALTMADRFWSHVIKGDDDDCWLWTGSTDKDGYGKFRTLGEKHSGAHRVAYQLEYREVPADRVICHRCDTPQCCNPNHLFAGTMKENHRDRDMKGRNGTAKLTKCDVERIIKLHSTGRYTQKFLASVFDVHGSQISRIVNHKGWQWVSAA